MWFLILPSWSSVVEKSFSCCKCCVATFVAKILRCFVEISPREKRSPDEVAQRCYWYSRSQAWRRLEWDLLNRVHGLFEGRSDPRNIINKPVQQKINKNKRHHHKQHHYERHHYQWNLNTKCGYFIFSSWNQVCIARSVCCTENYGGLIFRGMFNDRKITLLRTRFKPKNM